MEIQWSLVLFTALSGMGGWMFVCVAVDEFLGRTKKTSFLASVVAFVVAVVGGLCSVTHLSHPDRILGALSHPTSGIFTEAVLIGLFCVFVAIYVVLLKREVSAGARKVIAVIAAVLGVLLAFMAGESYLMSSRPNWDTQLLPLGYALTAAPAGVAAYLAVVSVRDKDADVKPYYLALIVAGVLAAVGALAFAVSTDEFAAVATLTAVCVIAGGVVPVVSGALMRSKPQLVLALAIVSVICAFVSEIAYRCIMWMVATPIADLFGIVI